MRHTSIFSMGGIVSHGGGGTQYTMLYNGDCDSSSSGDDDDGSSSPDDSSNPLPWNEVGLETRYCPSPDL